MGNKHSRLPVEDFAHLINRSKEPEQKYTKEEIEQGFRVVAKYLNSKKLDVAIVTVGGAVNTVLLKSRASTSDVDFFYRTKDSGSHDNNLVQEVMKGAQQAEKELKLGSQWLNNHTVVFIEEGMINDLYAEAIKQNEKVFCAKGLTVYAAPWNYALMAKLDRAAKPGAKSYDMTDAIDYLRYLVRSRGGRAVKKSELEAWATKYKLGAPPKTLVDKLAAGYKATHCSDGIINC